MVAYTRMRLHDVSQLPVLDGEKLVGIIDESDLLLKTYVQSDAFENKVGDVMTRNVQTVHRKAQIDDLLPIFDAGRVAVISDDLGFHGLITRIDVLNYLRKRHKEKKRGS
jgi:cystathionine beta-synthase